MTLLYDNDHVTIGSNPLLNGLAKTKGAFAKTVQEIDPHSVAEVWLSQFASQVISAEQILHLVETLFLPYGWLRDSLTFTWDMRSLNGHGAISSYISSNIKQGLTAFQLDYTPGLEPRHTKVNASPLADNGGMGIEFAFTFTGEDIIGRGHVRLMHDGRSWKALTVFTKVVDLKGYEEAGPEEGTYDGHSLAWKDVNAQRRLRTEEDPEILIVGAGQCGISLAACLKQMNIRALVIEKNMKVGDNWRKRYPTLSLHTARSYCPFLYQPYPRTWPIFVARDKLADWMENYALAQDLTIWTNSTTIPKPCFNPSTLRWTVFVDRDGTPIKLTPKHIVMAIGVAHKPRIPPNISLETFKGVSFHSSDYRGGAVYKGKRAIVVGACNTAADICQDLYTHGAASVTMIQRSATCVVTRAFASGKLTTGWPEGVDVEISDFKSAAYPFKLMKEWEAHMEDRLREVHQELHEGLKKAGFKVTLGEDGSGQWVMFFERGGGYFIDVGCAELISSGKVKVKGGTEPASLTADGMLFKDGSFLPADLIIFATGYENGRTALYDMFGSEVADSTGPLWGVDEEGELRGTYRPSGHPALWFAVGNFMWARYGAKQLAIQLKATDLGLMKQYLLSTR